MKYKCWDICSVIIMFVCLGVIGCSKTVAAENNVMNTSEVNQVVYGDFEIEDDLIHIKGDLYYDRYTYNVYVWEEPIPLALDTRTNPSAYYAPNGFPFWYDTTSHTLQMYDMSKVVYDAIVEYEETARSEEVACER